MHLMTIYRQDLGIKSAKKIIMGSDEQFFETHSRPG